MKSSLETLIIDIKNNFEEQIIHHERAKGIQIVQKKFKLKLSDATKVYELWRYGYTRKKPKHVLWKVQKALSKN